MSAHYPIPRSHPGRPVKRWSRPLPPLPESRGDFVWFAERDAKWQPLLSLFDQICSAPSGAELYGSMVMGGGMVLAARLDVAQDEGVILIYFDPSKRQFSLHYRHREVEPEQVELCSEEEAGERLRLFLAYRFGVYRRKNA